MATKFVYWLGQLTGSSVTLIVANSMRHGSRGGAIRTVGEGRDSDLLKARGMIARMEHASAAMVQAVKNAVRLSDTPIDAYAAPPQLGQHTSEVLTGLLGYSESEVEALARNGVL